MCRLWFVSLPHPDAWYSRIWSKRMMPNHFRHCLPNKVLLILQGEHPWAEPKLSWVYSLAHPTGEKKKKKTKPNFFLIINIPKSYHLAPKEGHASTPTRRSHTPAALGPGPAADDLRRFLIRRSPRRSRRCRWLPAPQAPRAAMGLRSPHGVN